MKAETIALEALSPGLTGRLIRRSTAAPAPVVECCHLIPRRSFDGYAAI